MNLGSILAQDDGLPCAGRPVTFHLTTRKDVRQPRQHEVKAILYPVSEPDRKAAWEAARRYLREAVDSPYRSVDGQPDKIIDPDDLADEWTFQFLRLALYNDGQRLIDPDSFETFRRGLVKRQVEWLFSEYNELIKSEYPEVLTEAERKGVQQQLAGQAAGK